MNKKRNRIGQTLAIGVAAMVLITIVSCTVAAVIVKNEIVPENMGPMICWIINLIGAYIVSWYTAKRSAKSKMQMAAAVIGVYGCICAVMGRAMFSELELKMTFWMLALVGAAVLGGITSCMKKERKR